MNPHAIDNAAFVTSAVCLFAAVFTAFIVWRVASMLLAGPMARNRPLGHVTALVMAGLASILSYHMVLNRIELGAPLFSTESLANGFAQTQETIDGMLHPQHTGLVPVGGDGMPATAPSDGPRFIYSSPRVRRRLPGAATDHETWVD